MFNTHIDGDTAFNYKYFAAKLEQLYQEHLQNVQGVVGKKNSNKNPNFSFSVTFAPEKKLLGTKLKKDMDGYYRYTPGTTKTINWKLLLGSDLSDVDHRTERYDLETKIFKVFNDVEYKGTINGYDLKKKLYHILYEDGDTEDFYHNEVKNFMLIQSNKIQIRKDGKEEPRKRQFNSFKSLLLQNFKLTNMPCHSLLKILERFYP